MNICNSNLPGPNPCFGTCFLYDQPCHFLHEGRMHDLRLFFTTICSRGSYKLPFLQVACLTYIVSCISMYNAVYFALRVLHGVHLLSAETQFFSSHSSHCILPFLSHSSLFFMSSCCNSASCTTYNIHNIHKTDTKGTTHNIQYTQHCKNIQHTIYTT